ncbi:hypothetical protein BpHYR1_047342 [Brachionus plicatilis]|uniref:Uncharacterized protein n=1 Tax=Brachionus plicatilis TaxID=10195 RepID=A0A3M7RTN2_BRAPC|nr:hypothetical protein BpHYR1_047342 [Brachionus plicatilis]
MLKFRLSHLKRLVIVFGFGSASFSSLMLRGAMINNPFDNWLLSDVTFFRCTLYKKSLFK